MNTFKLSFPWVDGPRKGQVDIVIDAIKPREHYGAIRGEQWDAPSEQHARVFAHCAQSLVIFMDTIEAERPMGSGTFWGRRRPHPAAADDTRVWRIPEGAVTNRGQKSEGWLVTAESYSDGHKQVEAWCEKRGWRYATLPPGYGFWFPAGEKGTRLTLISPRVAGVAVEPLVPLLCDSLPRWTEDVTGPMPDEEGRSGEIAVKARIEDVLWREDGLRSALLGLALRSFADDYLEMRDGSAPRLQALDTSMWLTADDEARGVETELRGLRRLIEERLAGMGLRAVFVVASEQYLVEEQGRIRGRLYGDDEDGAG